MTRLSRLIKHRSRVYPEFPYFPLSGLFPCTSNVPKGFRCLSGLKYCENGGRGGGCGIKQECSVLLAVPVMKPIGGAF